MQRNEIEPMASYPYQVEQELIRQRKERLEAAAPEMLAALKRCLAYGDLLPELADEARAVIAKVEG